MGRYNATPQTKDGFKRRAKVYFKNCKSKFLSLYGHSCSCCGETEEAFLTIEHIKGQAGIKKKKAGASAYREAISEYRPDLYKVLCYNCNLGRRFLGYCPHELGSLKNVRKNVQKAFQGTC